MVVAEVVIVAAEVAVVVVDLAHLKNNFNINIIVKIYYEASVLIIFITCNLLIFFNYNIQTTFIFINQNLTRVC